MPLSMRPSLSSPYELAKLLLLGLLMQVSSFDQGSAPHMITDIFVNVTLYNKQFPQLQIHWQDNLPQNSSYNVIVKALNFSECPDPPCSLYGVNKPETMLIVPPPPMISYLDEPECNYMFGCNYTLLVETSNTKVVKTAEVAIPYCIDEVCSCEHLPRLPKLTALANVTSNETIRFQWSLKLKDPSNNSNSVSNNMGNNDDGDDSTNIGDDDGITDIWESLNSSKIYLKISEQTNPSLSWGGKLLHIDENTYSLKNTTFFRTDDTILGNIWVKVWPQLTSNAVLNLHSYIVDELRCAGPETFIKLQVPTFKNANSAIMEPHSASNIMVAMALACTCVTLAAVGVCIYRYRRLKSLAAMHKEEFFLTPFPAIVPMEDNINYVDKYVEEAQARGDIFEVPHSAIHLEEEVGEGAFGRVYKGIALKLMRMRGPMVVAIKQLKKNPSSDEVAEFLSEIEMLKGVGTHNNIVSFLGCCTIRPPYLMIMEYVGRGDLLSYLRTVRQEATKFKPNDANYVNERIPPAASAVKYIELRLSSTQPEEEPEFNQRQPKPSFTETTYTIVGDDTEYKEPFEYILDHKELHNFAVQIANGMRFLEQQEITHRDLAARNVLIDDRKVLKISDFGLSRHGIYTNTKTRKLPLRWLSIEAIRDNVYSNKSDVWAYGVVLWEIGTLGASPYPAISNHELIPYLLSGKRLEKPEICTAQLYTIMLQCWHEDPERRPTFEGLYKILSPQSTYVDINSLSDDYVFPPIQDKGKELSK